MRIITVGTFDGVHRGHCRVLALLRREAELTGLTPAVITFDRHPLETVAPHRAPKLIMHPSRRDTILRESGIEVICLPFDEALRRMSVRQWMSELRNRFDARAVVLGYDNKFGSDGREMPFEEYRRIGESLGLRVFVADAVVGCSSTAVRRAVEKGDMRLASEILGRPFSVVGEVVGGRRLGRTIGFPTANISVGRRQLLPATGVYAAETMIGGTKYAAMVNVGENPTVSDSGRIRIEAHLIGFKGDLYGRRLEIEFLRRIRDERKFDSIEDLRRQLQQDLNDVTKIIFGE